MQRINFAGSRAARASRRAEGHWRLLHGLCMRVPVGWLPALPGNAWPQPSFSQRFARPSVEVTRESMPRSKLRSTPRRPPLSIEEILRWADAYYERHGKRPAGDSGPIPEAPGESWNAVDRALVDGRRGLPAGSSIAKLLALHRPRWASPRFGKRIAKVASTTTEFQPALGRTCVRRGVSIRNPSPCGDKRIHKPCDPQQDENDQGLKNSSP